VGVGEEEGGGVGMEEQEGAVEIVLQAPMTVELPEVVEQRALLEPR